MDCSVNDFFRVLYQRCSEGNVEFRFLPSKKRLFIPLSNFKVPHFPKHQNIYFGVGTRDGIAGGKSNLMEIPALWTDLDFKDTSKEVVRERFKDFQLKPSLVVETGGGYHAYWLLKKPSTRDDILGVESYLKRISSFLGGDLKATDASHILRVPATLNVKPEYNPPRQVIIKKLDPSLEYNLSDFDFLPAVVDSVKYASEAQLPPGWQEELLNGVLKGERNSSAARLAGRLFGKGLSEEEILIFLLSWNQKNSPPLPEEEIKEVVESVARTHQRNSGRLGFQTLKEASAWPSPLAKEALQGLAGEIVRMLEPHTESDPVALLIQFLQAVGNIIGNNAFFQVEADRHYLKIFSVLVGETSKGRKGTSLGHIKNIFRLVESQWDEQRVVSGLSSGEGLIWQVRDQITKHEPIKEKGRVIDYQDVIIDPGETDKRLFVVETEFASTLRVIGREGNTLSPIIREAWDNGNLRTLTKNSPVKATGAHISILGHITADELRRYLDRTEVANGFANRFIWICVRRSKSLPEGGRFSEVDLGPVLKKLKEVVKFGMGVGEIKKDTQALELWAEVYPDLSSGKPGLFGAVISRAEAQVMRLACIYALLDQSNIVRTEHLLAALALWDYAEASARYIFGDATGDLVADRILDALRASPIGLTRTEIRDLFSRHMEGGKIDLALSILERNGQVHMVKEETGGKPLERWIAV